MLRRYTCLLALLLVAACSTGAAKFAGPDKSAPVWDLNAGKWEGTTNDLIHEPTVKPVEANDGHVGL
jgi:hypothetical protein